MTGTDPLIIALARRRMDLRLTQTKVAYAMDTLPSVISRAESGDRSPTLQFLVRWADALDCDLKLAPRADTEGTTS